MFNLSHVTGPGGDDPADPDTRGVVLNGYGFGATGTGGCADGALFCDGAAQVAWGDNILAKVGRLLAPTPGPDSVIPTITNDRLVEGSVLYILSNNVTHQNGPTGEGWKEALTGGLDGCSVTGGFQAAGIVNPPTNPNGPEVVAVQGGGSKFNVLLSLLIAALEKEPVLLIVLVCSYSSHLDTIRPYHKQ
jgi:hypothetical protein